MSDADRKRLVITSVTMKNTTDDSTLAQRLNAAMQAAGVTPQELAIACGVSGVAVYKWLTGRTERLKWETVQKCANVLKVNPEWLNDGTGARTNDRTLVKFDRETLHVLRAQMQQALTVIDELLERYEDAATPTHKRKRQRPPTASNT